MTRHEDQLRQVLHDTVDGIEPRPGLDTIRARSREQHPGNGRAWLLGAFGAAVATAAVVAGVAVLGDPRPTADPTPAGTPTAQVPPTGKASETPSDVPSDGASEGASDGSSGGTQAVPVYFAGDSPQGVSLYREFQRVDAQDHLLTAANLTVSGDALDPDYRSLWPDGASIDTVTSDGVGADAVIQVGLSDSTLRDRPPTMSEREAQLAVQQVVYTVQGTVQKRARVLFLFDGQATDTVLGVPTVAPPGGNPPLDVLSHVNITTPEQDETTTRELVVTGVASSFEGTVLLKVMSGSDVVLEDFASTDAWMGKLFPFRKKLDLITLLPGDYTLVASTDDASGGAEGGGAFTDDKDFTLP